MQRDKGNLSDQERIPRGKPKKSALADMTRAKPQTERRPNSPDQ